MTYNGGLFKINKHGSIVQMKIAFLNHHIKDFHINDEGLRHTFQYLSVLYIIIRKCFENLAAGFVTGFEIQCIF